MESHSAVRTRGGSPVLHNYQEYAYSDEQGKHIPVGSKISDSSRTVAEWVNVPPLATWADNATSTTQIVSANTLRAQGLL